MILCRLTTNPAVPAEIVDARRVHDECLIDVERLDGRPWHNEWSWSHGGWCLHPCYTITVPRGQIAEIVRVTEVVSPESLEPTGI